MNPSIDIEQIFCGAIEIEGDSERGAWLNEKCGDDAELRRKVDALLRAHFDAGKFMDETMDSTLSDLPPTKVGPYKLLEEIGEGGMGTVWVAEQKKPIKRRVAIKLIKAGMDSKSVLARFEAERQALAMMDHPNIARVLDGGMTDEGRPYFAMEYVKGVPLTEYCDQARLSVKERLELFLPICKAVQHAHQKGIIHRDLKPSNILICLYDGKPVPKVIDFGLAKAMNQSLTDQSVYTAQGMMIGTPLYMSPEQAEQNNLDIDTRTDIYSLGVILYELLTGTTPLEKAQLKNAAVNEMMRLIHDVQPPKPSTRLGGSASLPSVAAQRSIDPTHLTRIITGDLDWVVMRAIDKERTRRYETANGFAMDIQRHLCNEPVSASPPSRVYRVRKFIKRNRSGVYVAGAMAVLLLLGVTGTITGMFWAQHEMKQAVAARQAESRAKEKAVENEKKAKTNEMRAIEAAERADFSAQRQKEESERLQWTNEFMLNALQSGDPAFAGKHDMTIVEAMHNAVDDLERGVFDLEPGIEAYWKATIAEILHNNARLDEAEPLFQQALGTMIELVGKDDPRLAEYYYLLASNYAAQAHHEKAEALYKRAIELIEGRDDSVNSPLGKYLNGLAILKQMQRDYKAAEPYFLRAKEILESREKRDQGELSKILSNLAACHLELGKHEGIESIYSQAVESNLQLKGTAHPDTAISYNNLANYYETQGKYSQALPLYQQALEIVDKAYGARHSLVARFTTNIASIYKQLGQFEQAETFLKRSLEVQENLFEPDHPDILTTTNNLATLYWRQGKLNLSIPMFQKMLDAQKEKLGPENEATLTTMLNLGVNYMSAGRATEAETCLKAAKTGLEEILGASHPKVAWINTQLAELYNEQGRFEDSEPLFLLAAQQTENAFHEEHPNLVQCLQGLGYIYFTQKKFDQSIPLFERALAIQEKTFGRSDENTQHTLGQLAINYKQGGRITEAVVCYEEIHGRTKGERIPEYTREHLLDLYSLSIADHPEYRTKAIAIIEDLLKDARSNLPPESLELAQILVLSGLRFIDFQEYPKAEQPVRDCLAIREKQLPDSWLTFNTKALLGRVMLGQKRFEESESLLLEGTRGLIDHEVTVPPPGQPRITEALQALVDLYKAVNQPEDAAKWQAELDRRRDKAEPVQDAPKRPEKDSFSGGMRNLSPANIQPRLNCFGDLRSTSATSAECSVSSSWLPCRPGDPVRRSTRHLSLRTLDRNSAKG